MSLSDEGKEGEPKKNYTNNLIWMLTEVNKLIYIYKAPVLDTLEPMQGIIDFLPEKSKKELQDVNSTIDRFLKNSKLVRDRRQIKNLYRKISNFLLATHLREVGIRPRFSSGSSLGYDSNEEEEG